MMVITIMIGVIMLKGGERCLMSMPMAIRYNKMRKIMRMSVWTVTVPVSVA